MLSACLYRSTRVIGENPGRLKSKLRSYWLSQWNPFYDLAFILHSPVVLIMESSLTDQVNPLTISEAFASDVFRRYAIRLLHVAEQKLNRELRPKVSAEDVVQSAFKSFFGRLNKFQFDEDSPDAIWGLLVVITIRKCKKWEAMFRAEKRDIRRERRSESSSNKSMDSGTVAACEPSPGDVVMAAELVEQLMGNFELRQRQMLLLRIEGFELIEIAEKCKSSRRTVARTVASAKEILQAIISNDAQNL